MSKLPESVSALSPLGDAIREPKKARRAPRQKAAVEPSKSTWTCPAPGCDYKAPDDAAQSRHMAYELKTFRDLMRGRVALCGTWSGYQAHKDRGEKPCEPCREATRAYHRARRANPVIAEQERVYRRANADRIRERNRDYLEANRDRVNAIKRERYAAETDEQREQRRASQRARRAAKKAQV